MSRKQNIKSHCLYCGKVLTGGIKSRIRKYCSKKHQGLYRKNKIRKNCSFCGRFVWIIPARERRKGSTGRFYCSNKHSSFYISKIAMKKYDISEFGIVEKICKNCKRPFKRRASKDINHYTKKQTKSSFCSRKCLHEYYLKSELYYLAKLLGFSTDDVREYKLEPILELKKLHLKLKKEVANARKYC